VIADPTRLAETDLVIPPRMVSSPGRGLLVDGPLCGVVLISLALALGFSPLKQGAGERSPLEVVRIVPTHLDGRFIG